LKTRKDLFYEFKGFIDSIPIIDIHSHIDYKKPHAENPKDILFYHYISTELRSAGLPFDAMSTCIPINKALKKALPYFSLIRNTSTYWYFMKMLKDLYGFEYTEINDNNWKKLLEVIKVGTKQRNRHIRILVEKAKIKKTFLTLRSYKEKHEYNRDFFVGALRLDPIINQINRESISNLGLATNISTNSIEGYIEAINTLFKRNSLCSAATISFQPDFIYSKSVENKAKKDFKKLINTNNLSRNEGQNLSSYIFYKILGLAKDYNFVFQIMLGSKRPVLGASPPDYAITGFETNTVSSLCQVFNEFNELKFDIFSTSNLMSHELTVISKNYPNIFISGYWWYVFYPKFIKQLLLERIQMLPINKSNGFFSDAYVVEWSYAKSKLIRLQISKVLTDMVVDGYLTKELAKEIAVRLLFKNPKNLYNIN
jgi:glucuronate isomerase